MCVGVHFTLAEGNGFLTVMGVPIVCVLVCVAWCVCVVSRPGDCTWRLRHTVQQEVCIGSAARLV